jgi:hypothetical protein
MAHGAPGLDWYIVGIADTVSGKAAAETQTTVS